MPPILLAGRNEVHVIRFAAAYPPYLAFSQVERRLAEQILDEMKRARTKWITQRSLPQKFRTTLLRLDIPVGERSTAAAE